MESDDSDVPIQWRTDDDEDGASDNVENSYSRNNRNNSKRQGRRRRRDNNNQQPEYSSDDENNTRFPATDPRFLSREKWVNECFMAIRRGNLQRVVEIFHPDSGRPNCINSHMFNMGFPVGAGGTMKLPSSSTALHVAAWCGQSDIVRWLLNNGASAEERDGLHQLPVEVASTLDVKRVLGAATGIINISDKVERVENNLNNDITLVSDQFAIRLARIQAEMGEIDFKIDKSVREAAREEVLELRAALARKLARELKRFSRTQKEVKTDPLVWQKINKLERFQVDIDTLHKDIDDIKEEIDKRPMSFGSRREVEGEVEAAAGGEGGEGTWDKREIKKLKSF
jgi:hypothetical protein